MFATPQAYSAKIKIKSYPNNIEAGTTIKVPIKWKKATNDDSYHIIVQLENKTTNPNIQIKKEFFNFNKTGSKKIKLYIPLKTPTATNSKLIAAIISTKEEDPWINPLAIFETGSTIKTYKSSFQHTEATIKNNLYNNYALYVPAPYQVKKKYPLVVALHGAGGNGEDFISSWMDAAHKYQMIVITPTQLVAPYWQLYDWSSINYAINQTIAELNIDDDDILLTGVSAGAVGTYLFGLLNPNTFKAIAPIIGFPISGYGIEPDTITLSSNPNNQFPIFTINGAADTIFAIEQLSTWLSVLDKAGFNYISTIIPNRTHKTEVSDFLKAAKWFKKNHAPMLGQPSNHSVNIDENLNFQIAVKDPDNNLKKTNLKNIPLKANYKQSTHTFSWIPKTKDIGKTFQITVIAKDKKKAKSKRNFSITVLTQNIQ